MAPNWVFWKRSGVQRKILTLPVTWAFAAIACAVVLKWSPLGAVNAWNNLWQSIARRAQVDLLDDFQSGLDSWGSQDDLATWSYDSGGLVNPGKLALLTPSLHLIDYDVDCLAQVVSKGLGLAFRATGPGSYRAVKLVIEGSGPMPSIIVERYAVIEGHESPRVRVRCPSRFQADTLYRIHLKVRGDSFTLYIQGELIDYWSDAHLPSGGVGLFCADGERARIAWVRVSHNTDTTGKLCAFVSSLL